VKKSFSRYNKDIKDKEVTIMIKFNIRGENIEVTDSIRSYVEEKISKLEKYFTENQELIAHVNLKVYAEKTSKVEVTIPAKNITLRAEDTSQDLYGSVDLVQEKLERQIRKYKTKVQRKRNHVATGKAFETFVELAPTEELEESNVEIVRTKYINLKPMDAEEAVLQMELIDHDFFVFTDAETNTTSIVYRREDGNIGLIETK
jgi:putative sigma-54 modulation protein